MQQQLTHKTGILLYAVIVSTLLMISITLPLQAQDGTFATNTPVDNADNETSSLIFATNTPVSADDVGAGSDESATPQPFFPTNTPISDDSSATEETEITPLIFATNTPLGPAPSSDSEVMIEPGPQDILFNYGMRFWLEAEFVDLVFQQIQTLNSEDGDTQTAVNLLLYELETRFPSAPINPEQRLQLISAMINTPVGALDMRQILRPFIQIALDNNLGVSSFEAEGFNFSLMPANLDGIGDLDSVVQVSYERDNVVLYDEYLLAIANDSGSFTILPMSYDLPAVPFGNINRVTVEYLQDVNRDSLDELVLRVDDGGVSDRFYIIQARNGNAVSLVDPSLELRVGALVNWAVDSESSAIPDITVLETIANSAYPDWQCNSQIEYTWRYERNLYRRSQDLNARYEQVDSMGCTLADANLFSLQPSEAIGLIESAILEYGFDAPSGNRALMTLSMLYVMAGRLDDARNTASSIITIDAEDTWESQQANALIRATNASGNTATDICEALVIASEYPACDINAVLGRLLEVINLNTDDDLVTQLNDLGLPVLEDVVVSQIGHADRTAILFELVGSEWWGFYDGRDGLYRVAPIEAPISFPEAFLPQALLSAPQTAIDALLVENNPARTLTILDNLIITNPDIPLAPSALYLQALAYEFSGDRERARATYYAIWDRYSDSIWGEISAPHLELRQ